MRVLRVPGLRDHSDYDFSIYKCVLESKNTATVASDDCEQVGTM